MPDVSTPADRSWSPILPFLVFSYPITFLLFEGGRYCGQVCFSPTPAGVASLAVGLLVSALLATGTAALFRTVGTGVDAGFVRTLAAPPRPATVVLLGLLGAFVAFLTLDALTLFESVWKPIVLPLSFLLFAPVWVLYAATFPLAVLSAAVGVDPSPAVTLATHGVILGIGFPLSAVVQTYAVSAAVGGYQSADD